MTETPSKRTLKRRPNRSQPNTKARAMKMIGRTITDIELRPFDDGRGGRAFDPLIRFSDGSYITFQVQETDVGQYGISIVRTIRRS